MSSMQLSGYAEVALILFFLAFLAIGLFVLSGSRHAEWERCRSLPLTPDELAPRAPHRTPSDSESSAP
jgi:hypothetical protein